MGYRLLAGLFFVSIIAGSKKRFVDPASLELSSANEKFNDQAVEELESLKGILAEIKDNKEKNDEISISKSQSSVFSDLNGNKSAHKEINNEVNKNGKIFAKLTETIDLMKSKDEKPKSVFQVEVEVPSKGIHKVINGTNMEVTLEKKFENSLESKRTKNGFDKMNMRSFSEFKYNPREMADYIFWTGDEKGVVLTIEEFLLEGLMSRQEAINFLQSIKYNLDLMQSYYQGLKKVDKISSEGKSSMKRKIMNKEKFLGKPNKNLYEEQLNSDKTTPVNIFKVKPVSPEVLSVDASVKQGLYSDSMNMVNDDSSGTDYSEQRNKSQPKLPTRTKTVNSVSVNDDYDELLERIQVAGLLQKEYTLEEVIFELTKIIFSESLTEGNTEAQKAMQKFFAFLQNQVERGQISINLQRKILDILLSALMNALSEHPELMNRRREELQVIFNQNLPTSETLRQLLILASKCLSVENSH